ncbi:MAG: hypothetical protein ACJA2Y_001083 [Cycloclasticus pugetii]|jgi:hypothetical protein|uniref:PilZ domain-containing protein n=1 Tax=Cycloclasticus TaxID=34067 RepID=UPI00037DA17C|nr:MULTISPECIES: PilZ domain-containing protein [Cycloclasticus]SHI94163.1 PilZ domain-containing protein [Cycloclasticus pugetii]|tara:strand:- start:3119 stop:3418 length:300 start_codon:yes stop_codon:yes gene_type:complete
MPESTDHRKFSRSTTECNMVFTHPSTGAKGTATSLNLSAAGILFKTHEKLTQGCSLEISVQSVNPNTPPLNAIVEINRVTPIEDNLYEIAATIEGIKGV